MLVGASVKDEKNLKVIKLAQISNKLTKDQFLNQVYSKSKSEGSKDIAEKALLWLDRLCEKNYGKPTQDVLRELRATGEDSAYVFLNNYVTFLEGRKPSTIRTYFSFVRKYLRTQGIKTHSEDVKDFVTLPKIHRRRDKAVTKEEIKKLLDNANERHKAIYLILSSSAMRIGECMSLCKKDFDFTKNPTVVTIPAEFTKTKESRETFISREAKEVLLRLVKDKDDNDRIFGYNGKTLRACTRDECQYFWEVVRRCGLQKKYENSNRNTITLHALRAYAYTIAEDIHGKDYAGALSGHHGYMSQYYRKTPAQRAEMYLDLEPYLAVYTEFHEDKRKEGEIEQLRKDLDKVKKAFLATAKDQETKEIIENIFSR